MKGGNGGDASAAAALEDLTVTWMTGIPTTILFLGKSFLNVPKGPGGIVITDPASVSPQKPVKKEDVDFSVTTNM